MAELDGLRGLAVLLVLVSHVSNDLSLFGGAVGVTVFFVLSGYLITGNLLREHARTGAIDLRSFVRRRVARLVPSFAIVLTSGLLIVGIVDDPWTAHAPTALPWIIVPLANAAYVSGVDLGPFEHFWSLAVEEQTYLVWPVVLAALLGARIRRWALPLVLALTGAALVWRLVGNVVLPTAWATHGFDTSVYALLLGGCVSMVQHRSPVRAPRVLGVLALIAGAALTIGNPAGAAAPSLGVWVEPVAAVLVVAVLLAAPSGIPVLRLRVLRWFGTISYGLYLWHFVLLTVAPGGVPAGGVARIGVAVVGVGIAAASWYLVERRFLSRSRRALDARPVSA